VAADLDARAARTGTNRSQLIGRGARAVHDALDVRL
jgi:hypothetical protein